jgi:tetratricopeptide (TPR) repeat protein
MDSLFQWLSLKKVARQRNDEVAAASVSCGNRLLGEGDLEAAAGCYREALAVDPENVGACVNLGYVLKESGQVTEAQKWLEQAVAIEPRHADAHYLLGLLLEQDGEQAAALRHLVAAVESKPEFVFAWSELCRLNLLNGNLDEVQAVAERAVAANPGSAELHQLLGNAFLQRGNYQAALQCYDRAQTIQPDLAEAHDNRGLALHGLKRFDEALASFGRALELKDAYAEAHYNRGNTLKQMLRLDEALASYDRALAIDPRLAAAANNRGLVLHELGRLDAAKASYRHALALEPDNADAHWNLSLTLLLQGDFADGWPEYEWRWRRTEVRDDAPVHDRPLWLGDDDLHDRTILLQAEQGLGDTIQFCRYVPRVAALGAKVVLEVQPALVPLLGRVEGVTRLVGRGESLPAYDCHCPLLSLPLAFKTGLADISGLPYLQAPMEKRTAWEAILGERRAPRIGLVWSGSTGHQNDRNRSIPLADYRQILRRGISYHCLQKEIRPADRAVLAGHPEIRTFEAELKDFADTAALIELMDLVITVDTSVAHLAGAMGKEAWVLLPFMPDWRWLLNRADSPWYESVRLFRQPEAGDWQGVLSEVARMAAERFAERN